MKYLTDIKSAQLNSPNPRESLRGLKELHKPMGEEHRDGGADHWTVTVPLRHFRLPTAIGRPATQRA